jgi:membrane protease YdiL (CAAX protease family)
MSDDTVQPRTPWYSPGRQWIARHPVAAFLIMAYVVTVATALSPALTRRDLLPYDHAPYDLLAHIVGSAVPAFIVTAALRGSAGVREFFHRCLRWRVGIRWYLLAVLAPTSITLLLATALAGTAPLTAVAEDWPTFFTLILPSLAFAFVLSNFYEEIGWTGFLLDRVQDRYRPMKAAAIVSVPFALAHIPGFIVEGGSVVDGLVILGVLFIPQLASRIIAAWFYNNTNRSVLIVGLFHSAYNVTTQAEFSGAFLPVSDDIRFLILVAVPIIPAILIAVLTRGRLSYRPQVGLFQHPTNAPTRLSAGEDPAGDVDEGTGDGDGLVGR